MEAQAPSKAKKTFVVDLEGGIIKPGLFTEGVWALLRETPLNIARLPIWLFTGKLSPKVGRKLNSKKIVPPINEEVLNLAKKKHGEGHVVILKHRRHRELAQSIQYNHGCFSDLTSSLPEQLVSDGFTYIPPGGDPALWKKAKRGLLLGSRSNLESLKKTYGLDIEGIESKEPALLKGLIKSLRPHQWSKNVLIFLSIFILYRYNELNLWIDGLKAFIAFSLVSSSTYIVNDLFDLESDRLHPVNKKRPFAAGDIPLYWGAFLYTVLITTGLVGAYLISVEALKVLVAYAFIGLAYTFYLKRVPVLDTFILAGLYVWRVFMGVVVFNVTLSPWIYMVGLAFFFSLANMKRVSE